VVVKTRNAGVERSKSSLLGTAETSAARSKGHGATEER
jgi:hypothetical protein